MARETPAILADEIAASAGPWTVSNALLRPIDRRNKASFDISISIAGRDVRSIVHLWTETPAAREGSAALRRGGYEIVRLRSKPVLAHRPLHGLRELDAEVRRLEALAEDTSSLALFPPRRPRPPGTAKGARRFADALFQRLRQRHGWSLESVTVGRKGRAAFVHAPGWSAGAWCSALGDGEDRKLAMTVQIFSKRQTKQVDSEELARLTRTVRSRLSSLGYEMAKLNWPSKRPQFAMFGRHLPNLAAARRGRIALDRTLFGD